MLAAVILELYVPMPSPYVYPLMVSLPLVTWMPLPAQVTFKPMLFLLIPFHCIRYPSVMFWGASAETVEKLSMVISPSM